MLVLYSDGIVEAESTQQEHFGEQRLLAVITESLERSCGEIRDDILKRVHSFVNEEQAQDDLTLVVIRAS